MFQFQSLKLIDVMMCVLNSKFSAMILTIRPSNLMNEIWKTISDSVEITNTFNNFFVNTG